MRDFMEFAEKEAGMLVRKLLGVGHTALVSEGSSAKDLVHTGADIATVGDEVVGDAVIEALRKEERRFAVYTEEKGKIDVPEGEYTVIIDDIDGTLNFKTGRGMMPHGTVIGVFEGTLPRFEDCIAAGFLEFNSKNLFYAERGRGSFIVTGFTNGNTEEERIRTSGRKRIEGDFPLKISYDMVALGTLGPEIVQSMGTFQWPYDARSKAFHIAQIAAGDADALVTADNVYGGRKRIGPEEIGPLYLLVKEAGGHVTRWDGKDIGEERIIFTPGKTPDVIVSATRSLCQDISKRLYELQEVSEYLRSKNI